MAKLILLLTLIPVIAALAARAILYHRLHRKTAKIVIGPEAREVAVGILAKAGAKNVELLEKRHPFLPVTATRLVLPPKLAASHLAGDVAEAALLAGLVVMAGKEPRVIGWRARAVRFGWAFPAFSAVVLAFAVIVSPGNLMWWAALLVASCGAASITLWLTQNIERSAASLAARLLTETAIIPRRQEAEIVATLTRATAWKRIVPGVLSWIGGDSKK